MNYSSPITFTTKISSENVFGGFYTFLRYNSLQ